MHNIKKQAWFIVVIQLLAIIQKKDLVRIIYWWNVNNVRETELQFFHSSVLCVNLDTGLGKFV